jgi:hypothetical protein
MGNYFGGLWSNPEMQQEFLTAYLEMSLPDALDYTYQFLKATIVFGSMYTASYDINTNSSKHAKAELILKNLERNLRVLDQKYDAMKMSAAKQ